MNKKLIIFLVSCLTFTATIVAQGDGQMRERVEARRVSFITNKLALTPEEAKQFWPIFNQYEEKRKAIRKSYALNGNLQLMSDAEVQQYVDQSLEIEAKQLELKKEFFKELKAVLPIRKIAMLPRVEKRFKQFLLQRLKDRNRNNR
ncbi:MAG: hypothetical protein AAF960_08820 [Bacteroidota bacterium]